MQCNFRKIILGFSPLCLYGDKFEYVYTGSAKYHPPLLHLPQNGVGIPENCKTSVQSRGTLFDVKTFIQDKVEFPLVRGF